MGGKQSPNIQLTHTSTKYTVCMCDETHIWMDTPDMCPRVWGVTFELIVGFANFDL